MKFGAPTNIADLLNAVVSWVAQDPPALFVPERVFLCGPNEKEFNNREVDINFLEIRANKITYEQPFITGGGTETQVLSIPLQFSMCFRFDVDWWKSMGAALTSPLLDGVPQGAWPFVRLFIKQMNAFYFNTGNVSKLVEPVRPTYSEILERTQNNYFKARVIFQCKINEDMAS